MTQLVGELHPDSYLYLYLSFFVYSTNNAKDCKYVWWYTILLCPARWSWRSNKSHEISFIGWNSRMPRIFFFYAKQGKLGSSIQPTNVLKPEPIHATFSINKFLKFGRHVWRHFTAWFRARLWRGVWKLAPSRDFRNQRARGQKTIGSHLNEHRRPVDRPTHSSRPTAVSDHFFATIIHLTT